MKGIRNAIAYLAECMKITIQTNMRVNKLLVHHVKQREEEALKEEEKKMYDGFYT
jgi:hypothetical protein